MKLAVILSVLTFLSVNATQWKDIKSPMDSPKYIEIMDKLFPNLSVIDEQKITGKITGGERAELGQFPFQVYMYVYEGDGMSHICGGSVS